MKIIKFDKSIIPACDVSSIEAFTALVENTCDVEGVGGYKLGLELALSYGLPALVEEARALTDLPLIYDHQKAGNDIPELGEKFASACKKAGVDAVILFPFVGRESEKAWIRACKKKDFGVIVGGEMTHKGFLEEEGGCVSAAEAKEIYGIACDEDVSDFVVPGNKSEKIKDYKKFLELKGVKPVLYSPGLVAQGGEITESGKAAGEKWHAIVGRALYEARDVREAAKALVKQLI